MTHLIDLAARVEAMTGACPETDALIALAAYEGRWPIASYGGQPINYDPALWMERHCFEPTASLDAALAMVPADSFWRVGHDGDGPDPSLFKAVVSVSKEGDIAITFRMAIAETAPLAMCAAALRARAYLWLANRAHA